MEPTEFKKLFVSAIKTLNDAWVAYIECHEIEKVTYIYIFNKGRFDFIIM